jgi:nicotinamide-nucleotide amidase
MQAAILAVGSELLGTDRLDTNSLRITKSFQRYGVELKLKSVVGDEIGELASEVEHALAACDLVVITGGIGPTTDDITREAVAQALGRQLIRDESIVEGIRRKFASFGRDMPDSNRKQADVIEGAMVLENRLGTAPGQRVDDPRGTIFLMPGVPREVEGLIPRALDPWLAERGRGREVEQGHLRVACVSESSLEQLIQPYYERYGSLGLSVLSKPGEILLQVSGVERVGEVASKVEEREQFLADLLGEAVYSRRPDEDLEGVVGALLRAGGATAVTAESCTGGLVAERLTRVPGSSQYFLGSTVTYSYELKCELLGVPRSVLERHGAVSREVVTGMAVGARRLLGGDYCIAISGVAGPGGGSPDKPVGTVDLAVAGPDNDIRHLRVRLPGGRALIREQAAQWGLDMLRRFLLAADEPDASYLAPRAPASAREVG